MTLIATLPGSTRADIVLPIAQNPAASETSATVQRATRPVRQAPEGHGLAAASAAASSAIDNSALGTKLLELGDRLRTGPHNVVSDNGEKIVWLVRSLAKTDEPTKAAVMRKLAELARAQVPEALTFMGFAAEGGYFGVERSPLKAAALYSAAAQEGYQPALYNLALMSAYGRGRTRDLPAAAQLLRTALSVAPDASGRVCGMASFIAWRQHDAVLQAQASGDCASPLAGLALASSRTDAHAALTPQLAQRLRDSLATGVDDALPLIELLAARQAAEDTSFTYCRWALIHRYWLRTDTQGVAESAEACIDAMAKPNSSVARMAPVARQMAVAGLATGVPADIEAIKAARKSNEFRYGMAVPYLPFGQVDVEWFASVLTARGSGS
jgi:TPR repeat protein